MAESVSPPAAKEPSAPTASSAPAAPAAPSAPSAPSVPAAPAAPAAPAPSAPSAPATHQPTGFRQSLTSRRRSSEKSQVPKPAGKELFYEAAEQTRYLLGADMAVIADLRSFRTSLHRDEKSQYFVAPQVGVSSDGDISPSVERRRDSAGNPRPLFEANRHLNILGESHCQELLANLMTSGASRPAFLESIVVKFLNEYNRTGQVIFHCDDVPDHPEGTVPEAKLRRIDPTHDPEKTGAFWSVLPPTTTAYAAVPFSDHDGESSLLLLVASSRPYFRFEESDRTFMASVGAICISTLLKRRVLDADAAKLSFVSRVSHELRTPLWAILAQLELIRMTLPEDALAKVDSLLQVAEACGDSLGTLLEDVLDFGKLSQTEPELVRSPVATTTATSQAAAAAAQKRPMRQFNLEALVIEVAIVSWKRRQRKDIIEMHAAEDRHGKAEEGPHPSLKILVDVDRRPEGWDAILDVAGLKRCAILQLEKRLWADGVTMTRILLNLVGNSLKFTREGRVVVSIKELPTPTPLAPPTGEEINPNVRWVEFTVEDTGCGMEDDWIQNDLVRGVSKGCQRSANHAVVCSSPLSSRRILSQSAPALACPSAAAVRLLAVSCLPLALTSARSRETDGWEDPGGIAGQCRHNDPGHSPDRAGSGPGDPAPAASTHSSH